MHLSKGERVRFGVCDLEHCGTHIKICIYIYILYHYIHYCISKLYIIKYIYIYLDIRYCTIDWQANAAGP